MRSVYLIIIIILFFAFISLSFGEIYEYRGVVFYPNGSQTVDVSKLHIDYENPDAFSIYISYRNSSFYLPYSKNITLNLPPKKFNISITISASRISRDEWRVYYKIINNYPYSILFNISFPGGFNIKNASVLVPAKSYKIITLSKIQNSNILYFGDSNISFEVPAKLMIRYSLPIPFSIIKSNKILSNGSIEWTAIYIIKNDKNVSLNVNASYWAVVNNTKIDFGNYSYIIEPNENVSQSFNITSDYVPIFYLKFYAWRDVYETIKIKPAIKVDNSYIIGIGKVEGLSFNIPYYNYMEREIKKKKEEKENEESSKTINQMQRHKKEEKSQTQETKKPSKNEMNKQEKERKYPLIIEEKFKKVAAAIATVTTTSITAMLIPPIFRRRSYIVDKGIFSIKDLELLSGTVYVPEGCKLGNILPGGITIIKLTDVEKDLARDLHEIYDIPLNSAKAIILGVKYGGRVFLSDKKAYDVAVEIGLEAYLF
ncbi:hypothetical protein [Methanocaldococcus jannaschii]|nr:hypothetical protein [Methanocaldococcus jannaschii]